MKKFINGLIAIVLLLCSGVCTTGCSDDDYNTDQYQKGVHLNVFGPSPVMRGGQLRFLGSNLDQVAQVVIPGVDPITNIEVVTSGIPSEIRVTVPKDGSEPGIVQLVTRTDEVLSTETPVAYIEPIVIEEFTPEAMPGQKIIIKGDYLNLIHAVGFAENVTVSEADFTKHGRYAIELAVPETARTGKLSLYDVDITKLADASADVTYNIVETETALIVGVPAISAVTSPRGTAQPLGTVTAKLGERVTIAGEYLQLVASLQFGDADATLYKDFTSFEVSEDGKSLSFALPAEAPDGDVNLVCKSGVPVPVGKLLTVAPSGLKAAPLPVKAGHELTITGSDLDVVAQIIFPNCAATDVQAADGKIVAAVPAEAVEGDVLLVMANGKQTPVPFTLVKPSVTGFNLNPAAAGSDVVIQGTDLDLIVSATFEGGSTVSEFTVSDDATALTVAVPLDAAEGAVTLALANGTTVVTPSLSVDKPVFCYVPDAGILTDNDLKAGDLLTVAVENIGVLTAVEIDGTPCQYVANGGNLYIGIPENAGFKSKLRLVSSNGEVTYDLSVVPNTEKHTVIWQGAWECDGWNGLEDLSWDKYDWSLVTPGTEIKFTLTPIRPADGWACMSLRHGDGWAALPEPIPGQYDLDVNAGSQVVSAMLDAGVLSDLVNNGGLIITGHNFVLSQVELVEHISLETVLWQGEAVADDWGNQPGLLSDGGAELQEAGAKVGSVVRFYVTPTADTWNLQVVEGHWGGNFCDYSNESYDLAAHNGAVEIVLTQEMLDKIYTVQNWGNTFLLNGDNIVCTKVTVE